MVFNPCNRRKVVCNNFPAFKLADCTLLFVDHFKYLGHIINNCLHDDSDIKREIKSLFVRANLLCRRFSRCSLPVLRFGVISLLVLCLSLFLVIISV